MRTNWIKFFESFEELVKELDGEVVYTLNMGTYRFFIHKDDEVVKSLYADPDEKGIRITELRNNDVPCYGDGQWWNIEYDVYYDTKWQDMGNRGSIKVGGWPCFEALVREWMQ